MQNEVAKKFVDGTAGREDLVAVIDAIRGGADVPEFKTEKGDYSCVAAGYLKSDDPKIRINAAKIIAAEGDSCADPKDILSKLIEVYKDEQTLYVRKDLLEAVSVFETSEYRRFFTRKLDDLKNSDYDETALKHVAAEIRLLEKIIGGKHTFSGFSAPAELLMTTLPGFEETTAKLVKAENVRTLGGAVRASVQHFRDVAGVRTVDEFLFLIPKYKVVEFDAEAVSTAVAESGIYMFLERRHKEQERPYRFRASVKADLDAMEKAHVVKDFAFGLEQKTDYKLVNSTDDYELEFRIVMKKDGNADAYVKLFTYTDERFAYRTESFAMGLKPVIAACAIEFAKPFLKERPQVLDPFCGVGTLLSERAAAGPVKNIYGTDTFGPAIDKARKNLANAGLKGNFINRDFYDFRHEYLFDEIITELPYLKADASPKEKSELKIKYRHFLEKASTHLAKDGVIVVLVKKCEYFDTFIERFGYETVAQCELSNGETEYVLKVK